MRRFVRAAQVAPVLFALVLAAGCGSGAEDTPTTPTPVDNTVTEHFSGNVGANQARVHAFASGSGAMTATITSVRYPGHADDADNGTNGSATTVGIAIGLWDGASCQLVITNDAAKEGITLVGQASAPGNFCVRIADNGALTAPATVDYNLDVFHRQP
jgi:hypothetical protein